MLYTGKGDDGTTKSLTDKERVSKDRAVPEALGNLDEINSWLGWCKVRVEKGETRMPKEEDFKKVSELLHFLQEGLFIVQAEVAGAEKTVKEERVRVVEKIIGEIEAELPPIKSFFISGGTEEAAMLDVARTLARRAERRVVSVVRSEERLVGEQTLKYLNRLSSILYALARWANFKAGIEEKAPRYE